jgi:TolA-binding protein
MPTVDTKTFRAPPAGEINVAPERPVDVPSRGHRMKSVVTVFLFALCSALAAAAWQHYGAQAKLMIANWTPPFALVASPSPAPAPATTAAQPDAPAVQAAATDQPAVPAAVPAQPQDDAAPAATAPSPDDATQLMQSMARDVADLRQQIVALKGNIAELKAGQQTLARDIAKPSESRPPELRTSIQPPRPRAAVPPRPAAALSHRPAPAYAPAQTAYVPPPMPQAAAPPMPPQQPAPPPAAAESDGEPVVRPPMPLR